MNKHEGYGRKNKREDAIEDGRELINVTQKEVDDWILSGEEYKIEWTEEQAREAIKEDKLGAVEHILWNGDICGHGMYMIFIKAMGRLPREDLKKLAFDRKVHFLFLNGFYGRVLYKPKTSEHYEIVFRNLSGLGEDEILGLIAHELAHVMLEHQQEPEKFEGETEELEEEANKLALEWGFGKEIEKLRRQIQNEQDNRGQCY